MKKFAFSLERMLNFQSQNLEKEMGILGRMTAERDALEARKRDMAEKAAGIQAEIARREAEGTTIFMLKACYSILESARTEAFAGRSGTAASGSDGGLQRSKKAGKAEGKTVRGIPPR